MAKESPERNEDRKESEKEYKLKKEEFSQFFGKDLVTTYKFYRGYLPRNAEEKFNVRQILVEIGKELLPSDDEFKNGEDKKEINKIKKEIDAIIKSANKTVKKQPTPGNRNYDFIDIGGKRVTCYQFTADEIKGKWTCLDTEYNKSSENFDKEQCKKYIPALVEIDNKILKYLVKYKILKKKEPTIKEKVLENVIETIFIEEQKKRNT